MWYVTDRDYIAHYGTKRHSGRYPYGSGDRPYQSSPTMAKREAKKTLSEASNKNKEAAKIYRGATKYRKQSEKLNKKIGKVLANDKNLASAKTEKEYDKALGENKKFRKLDAKRAKSDNEYNKRVKTVEQLRKDADAAAKKVSDAGYTIKTVQKSHAYMTGQQLAVAALTGIYQVNIDYYKKYKLK